LGLGGVPRRDTLSFRWVRVSTEWRPSPLLPGVCPESGQGNHWFQCLCPESGQDWLRKIEGECPAAGQKGVGGSFAQGGLWDQGFAQPMSPIFCRGRLAKGGPENVLGNPAW